MIDNFFNKLPGRSNRLGYRFTVLTITFSTVIMVFISVLQLSLEYRGMRNDLDRELDSIDVYVRNIAGDLWNLDEVQLQHAIEGLQRLPNIQGVEIRSTENNQRWQVGELVKGNILVREFELPIVDRQERLVIGHLKVVASLDGPYREIAKRALIIVVSNSAKSILVALFMLYLFRRFVTVRLDAIGKKVRKLGPMLFHVEDDALQPQQPMPKELDELGAFDWTLDQTTLELNRLKSAREADQALIVESEQRFRKLVEQAPEAILIHDVDAGAFIDANPRAEALLGCSREELLRGGIERFFAPVLADGQTWEASRRATEARVLKGETVTVERAMHTLGGRKLTCMVTLVHMPSTTGRYIRLTIIDVTQRIQNEAAIKQLNRRLVSLLHAAQEVSIIATDAQGAIEVFNTGAQKLLGYAAYEVMGEPLTKFHLDRELQEHALDRQLHKGQFVFGVETLVALARSGVSEVRNWTYVRKNGDFVPVSLVISAMTDESGAISGFLAIARDITAELAVETAELSTRLKSEFLANMSHEIRTPMNAIIGLSGLALKNDMPPRVQDYLHKIRSSGEHLLGIINDVLDISKIEAGKLEIEHVPFELEAVMDNVTNFIAERADAKGLELLFSIERDVPASLIGDPLRLGQVLVNYANNAVKFTAKGQVLIHVGVLEHTGSDIVLRFEVRDSGIGLSEAQMAKLFQSFSQADSSTTRQFGGTGLGLAISKSLAEGMGGQVGVSSNLGQGSTFWFTARLGTLPGSGKRLAPLAVDLHGKRVLVVDDNEDAALILCSLLDELGFGTEIAHSGQDAVHVIESAHAHGVPFDFVLMDWLMPGMDGLQAIEAIQALPIQHAPFILMATAHRRQELIQNAQALGVEHVLAKPVSGSMLVDTMMRLLGHAPSQISAPRSASQRRQDKLEASLHDLSGARILLVEDNALNQQVAYELLTDAGFVVDIAEDGQKAVNSVEARVLENLPYDLILMDMQMPVMDGVTATRLIRLNHASDKLPIVAMTANAMQVDRERCLAAGMNDFVTKPIAPAQLWQTLLRWIAAKEGQGHMPATTRAEGPTANSTVTQTEAANTANLPPALPDHIDGLDLQTGLMLMGGNEKLYFKTLKTFVATQAGVIDNIRQALQEGQATTAERHAHTLKGQAGYLGAKALQDTSGKLEELLATANYNPQDVEHTLQAAAKALDALLESVHKAFPQGLQASAPSVPQAPISQEQLAKVLQDLRSAVQSNDPDALDLLEQNKAALQNYFGQRFDEIEQALQGFDFEAAGLLLD